MATAALFVNGIGDAVFALPAIRRMSRFTPRLRVLHPDYGAYRALFAEFGDSAATIMARIVDGGWRLDDDQVDALLEGWTTRALLTSFSSPQTRRLEQAAGARTLALQGARQGVHMFERYQELCDALHGGRGDRSDLDFRPLADCRSRTPAPDLPVLDAGTGALVIHPETAAAKTFAPGMWVEALRALLADRPDLDIVVCGTQMVADLALALQHPRCTWVVNRPFETTIALVDAASAVIGVDSCVIHIADLQRRPTGAIFRTTEPDTWGLALTPMGRTVVLPPGQDPALPEALIALAASLTPRR